MNDTKRHPAETAEREPARPTCCGECSRFVRDKTRPGHGFCDNWATVDLMDTCICHANFGMILSRRGATAP